VVAGLALEVALGRTDDRLSVYHAFFVAMALLQAVAFLPLRGFTRTAK
jgi:hypothetical protein